MGEKNTWPGWQCVGQLGAGSFGRVYEIKKEEFGKTYSAALKVITIPTSPVEIQNAFSEGMDEQSVTEYFYSIVESIVNEFALMSELKGHTNIVSYEDHMVVKHENDIGWDILIRMELLTPLQSWNEAHAMGEEDVIKLGCDICKALEACQRKNIIHRDIKPENIFVNKYGNYKLGDFGIARVVEKTMSELSQKGTYTYIAPEVFHGQSYGVTADIYSLGIVLYRYLNGNRIPFLPAGVIRYSDREEAFAKRMSGMTVPPPAEGSQSLREVVLRALSFDPKDRFQSAAAFYQALEACARQTGEEDERTLMLFQEETDRKKSQAQPEANAAGHVPETVGIKQRNKKTLVSAGIALVGIAVVVGVVFAVSGTTKPQGNMPEPISADGGTEEYGQEAASGGNGELAIEDGSSAEESETSMFQKVIDFEKSKSWEEKHVIGIEYVPEEEEKEMIAAAADCTDTWDDYMAIYMGSDTAVGQVSLIDQTDEFKLYAVNTGENARNMLIGTPDHSYILAEGIHCTSFQGAQPVIVEVDYDHDGETELAVQIHILHGTGLSVDSLFMADKASDGHWYLFQLLNEDYTQTLLDKRGRIKIGDKYYFKLEDRTIAVVDPQIESEENSWQDEIGSIIDVECSEEAIILKAAIGLVPWNGMGPSGISSYNLGNGISAAVEYKGDGEWELGNFDYYNAQLDDYVEGFVRCYLTGDVQWAETEYHITFQPPEETVETCNITKISYDSDTLGDDSFRVDVDYTVDGMEEVQSMGLSVKQLEMPAVLDENDIYSIHSYDMWQIIEFYY